jgi:hypothetical protein
MVAAACSSLFLESRFAGGIASALQRIDPMLPAGPLSADDPHGFSWILGIATAMTTLVWLGVTLLTRPEPETKLREFYAKVHPAGPGWGPIAQLEGGPPRGVLGPSFFHWVLGLTLVYSTLFGTGDLLFGQIAHGVMLMLLAVISGTLLFWNLNRTGWTTFR